jgi:hypothetical protein
LLVFSHISQQLTLPPIVSRETIVDGRKETEVKNEKRDSSSGTEKNGQGVNGMVQLELPDNPSPEIQERLRTAKREYNKARKAKQRKKEGDKRAITVIYETFGFFGFYHVGSIQLYPDSNVWVTSPDGRADMQEAFRLLFNGYAPNFWEILFLVVVRISRETPSATFPLVTFLKRTYARTVYVDGLHLGEMAKPPELPDNGRI